MRIKLLGFVVALSLVCRLTKAQDLSEFGLLAHYPLSSNTEDVTGQQDALILENAPFSGAEGIVSNGIYFNTDISGSFLETPNILGVDHDFVAFSFECKLTDSLDSEHAIIIGGRSWRWLGAAISASHQLEFVANGIDLDTDFIMQVNQWYALLIAYQKSEGLARLFVNDSLILEIETELVTDPDDKKFTNYHGGDGRTFKGNLRNLRIYGPKSGAVWFEDHAKWTYRWNTFGSIGYEQMEVVGDTTIFGQPCKIIEPTRYASQAPFFRVDTVRLPAFFMYEKNDSVYHLRQDSFLLIYDFTMKPGDSLSTHGLLKDGEMICAPESFVLDSVSEAVIDDQVFRRQHGKVRFLGNTVQDIEYIVTETLGFTHIRYLPEAPVKFGHLIPANALTCLLDADAWAFCSYQSDNLYYNPGDENCQDELSLSDHENEYQDIVVSPNPTQGKIYIDTGSQQISSLMIYSADGQLLTVYAGNQDQVQLPIRPGVYIMQILTNKAIRTFKIIRN